MLFKATQIASEKDWNWWNEMKFKLINNFPGVALSFKAQAGQLEIEYQLDHTLRNKTKGLLGNYNGIADDDLIPKDSAVPLNVNSSLRDIHYQFGETCEYNTKYLQKTNFLM